MSGTMAFAEAIEQLYPYAKDINGQKIVEIAMRGKNGKFTEFQKVALNSLKESQAAEAAQKAAALVSNNQLALDNIKMLSNITKLTNITMVLSGLNLFATVAGFVMVKVELNKIGGKIDNMIQTQKELAEVFTNFKVKEVIGEHSDMLDCRKKQKYFSEERMRKLVADEYNVLDMLMDIFQKNLSANQNEVFFTMISLASMLSASLKYFDEVYYFNNKNAITSGDVWHVDHDKWIYVLRKMAGNDFIKRVQDHGLLEIGLNTTETDYFYKSYATKMRSLLESIEDNQVILSTLDDPELFASFNNIVSESAREELEAALKQVGANPAEFEKEISVAVA